MSMTGTAIQRRNPSVVKSPPLSSLENDGSCWTCVTRGISCDKGLPGLPFPIDLGVSRIDFSVDCQTCSSQRYVCEGYATRLHWKTIVNHNKSKSFADRTLASNGDLARKRRPSGNELAVTQQIPGQRQRTPSLFANWIPENPIIAASTTPLERRYLRHFFTHVCRVSTAIDNESNGLRNTILPMSATDPALLNTILAVPNSQQIRLWTWQNIPDPKAQIFLSTAVTNLRKNLATPEMAANQATIATIFLLSMLEIFNASTSRWRHHLRGAASLIQSRGGSQDLHPVIKRNLFMLDLQSALNVGEGLFFDSQEWMEAEVENKRKELDQRPDWPTYSIPVGRREACIIDPLLGTSVKLLSIMGKEARLFEFSRKQPVTGLNCTSEILSRGALLESQLRQLSLKNVPLSAIMIIPGSEPLSSVPPTVDAEMLEEAIATSEIFRHCALIYLFRVVRGDKVELGPQTRESLDEAFRLLPRVPDVFGPGSILGWSLTVMGSELPASMEEEREYIRCRWGGIHGLGLKHSFKAAELLEEVWRRKDRASETGGPACPRWMDVMRDLGWELVLI